MSVQPTLFDAPALPPGMPYRTEFIDRAEEAELLAWLGTLAFEPFLFRGYAARRQVVSFGWRYNSNGAHLERTDAIPAQLAQLRSRAETFAGLAAGALQQVLINE